MCVCLPLPLNLSLVNFCVRALVPTLTLCYNCVCLFAYLLVCLFVCLLVCLFACLFVFAFRNMLDFDFEKLCSVTMSNQNVYACLVCGKYFQGRGRGTHAYTHSLEAGHHVYINLNTLKVSFPSQPMALLSNACVSASFLPFQTCPFSSFALCVLCQFYCLPDNYEVIDSSLDDIKVRLCGDFGVFCALSLSLSVGVCGCVWVWVGVGVCGCGCGCPRVQATGGTAFDVSCPPRVLCAVCAVPRVFKRLHQEAGPGRQVLTRSRRHTLPSRQVVCVCVYVLCVCLLCVCLFVVLCVVVG